MRMLPNEFAQNAGLLTKRAPDMPNISAPLIIAMLPVMLVYWLAAGAWLVTCLLVQSIGRPGSS